VCRAKARGGRQAFCIGARARDDGSNAFRDQQLHAQQSDRARTGDDGGFTQSHLSDLGDRLHDRGKRLAEKIDAGTVMVNEVVYTHAVAQTPWGGVKQSGYGRTHGGLGLLELVSAQHIHVNAMPRIADVWWFPYTKRAGKLFRSFAQRFTTGSVIRSIPLLPQIIRRLLEPRTHR